MLRGSVFGCISVCVCVCVCVYVCNALTVESLDLECSCWSEGTPLGYVGQVRHRTEVKIAGAKSVSVYILFVGGLFSIESAVQKSGRTILLRCLKF